MVTAKDSFPYTWDDNKKSLHTILSAPGEDQALIGNITLKESGSNRIVLRGGAIHMPGIPNLQEIASVAQTWRAAYVSTLQAQEKHVSYAPDFYELPKILSGLFPNFVSIMTDIISHENSSTQTQRLAPPAAAGIFVVTIGEQTPYIFLSTTDEGGSLQSNIVATASLLGKGYDNDTRLKPEQEKRYYIKTPYKDINLENIFNWRTYRSKSVFRIAQAMVAIEHVDQMPHDLERSESLAQNLTRVTTWEDRLKLRNEADRERSAHQRIQKTMEGAIEENMYANFVPGISASFIYQMKKP